MPYSVQVYQKKIGSPSRNLPPSTEWYHWISTVSKDCAIPVQNLAVRRLDQIFCRSDRIWLLHPLYRKKVRNGKKDMGGWRLGEEEEERLKNLAEF